MRETGGTWESHLAADWEDEQSSIRCGSAGRTRRRPTRRRSRCTRRGGRATRTSRRSRCCLLYTSPSPRD
eukprot:4164227-Alexandrium_andersonii.AAC.1